MYNMTQDSIKIKIIINNEVPNFNYLGCEISYGGENILIKNHEIYTNFRDNNNCFIN